MDAIQLIRSELRERHVHLFGPTLLLGMGMYMSLSGMASDGPITIPELVVAISTLLSIPYLFIYGLRISPWEELQSLIKWGIITWLGPGFLLLAWAQQTSPQGAEQYLTASSAGLVLYSLLTAIVGATIVMTLSLVLRTVYRRITGDDGGGNSGETPEEKALSKEELKEFDHPNKKLRQYVRSLLTSA